MVVRVLACGYDAAVRTGKNTGLSEHCYLLPLGRHCRRAQELETGLLYIPLLSSKSKIITTGYLTYNTGGIRVRSGSQKQPSHTMRVLMYIIIKCSSHCCTARVLVSQTKMASMCSPTSIVFRVPFNHLGPPKNPVALAFAIVVPNDSPSCCLVEGLGLGP